MRFGEWTVNKHPSIYSQVRLGDDVQHDIMIILNKNKQKHPAFCGVTDTSKIENIRQPS